MTKPFAACVIACAALAVVARAQQSQPAAAASKPAAVTLSAAFTETIPGTLATFDMVPVKPEDPKVKPFFIGKTELTWDAFDHFAFQLDLTEAEKAAGVDAKSRPSKPYGAPDRGFGHQGYPAISVAYQCAERYCDWLSKKTGRKYRLPTVAEWQAACRNGTPDDQPVEKLAAVAWYWDNANDKTHPVGKLAANSLGLHDMLGNAAEWATNDEGVGVVCGGSFQDEQDDVHPKAVKPYSIKWQLADPQDPKSKWWLSDGPQVGFRVVCEP